MTKNIPITYAPQKVEKQKINYKKLYQTDCLSFSTKIGFITNLSTAMYELQSKYDKKSEEYKELDTRLKLCCKLQSAEIDKTKGLIVKGIPKHWLRETKINEEILEKLSAEELNEVKFNNKLAVGKTRPYFMRYLYPTKNAEYKNYLSGMNLLSVTLFGKKLKDLGKTEITSENYKLLLQFKEKNNPLLETNGTMNRICYHMENELRDFKRETARKKDCEEMFEILFNKNIDTKMSLFPLLEIKYKKYIDFKKSKALKSSSFNSYEQYFKAIRNECLEEISNNMQELANLSVYLCYKMYNKSQKDFAWDIFGSGILENIMGEQCDVEIPHKCEFGDIQYLGSTYINHSLSFKDGKIDVEKTFNLDDFEFSWELGELEGLSDFEFSWELGELEGLSDFDFSDI